MIDVEASSQRSEFDKEVLKVRGQSLIILRCSSQRSVYDTKEFNLFKLEVSFIKRCYRVRGQYLILRSSSMQAVQVRGQCLKKMCLSQRSVFVREVFRSERSVFDIENF